MPNAVVIRQSHNPDMNTSHSRIIKPHQMHYPKNIHPMLLIQAKGSTRMVTPPTSGSVKMVTSITKKDPKDK